MTRLVPDGAIELEHQLEHLPAVRRSRLPVGSSASTQRGAVTSARASATRWRSPPESSPGRCSTRWPEADALEHRALPARATAAGAIAPDRERHRDVLQRR